MDPRQLATYDALYHEIDPEIAAIFKHACDLLDRLDEPGIVYLLGHAGRELSNAVLERIAQDQPAVAEIERAKPGATAEGVPSLRERLASLLELTLDDERLDRMLGMLGDDQRDTIARALRLERAHPLVRSWLHVQGSLVASTHYRRGAKPPSPERAREAFVQLAGVLFNRIGPYFDAQAELDVLLETTTPTAEHVARLRETLVRPQLRLRFFHALKNPAWLVPLQDGRFFDSPPEWVPTADGGRRLVAWPEGECLIRFAADSPELVVRTLLRVPTGLINPAVWQVVARGALSLPPAAARRLVPTLVRALRATPVRFFNDTVADVAASLAKAGDQTAFPLTEAVLGLQRLPVDKGPEETKWFRRQSKRLLESLDLYELHGFLEETIPLLAAIDPIRTWDLLLARLRRARDILSKAGFDDEGMSHHWCTSLDRADTDDDLRSQLAVAAMRVARDLLALEPSKATDLLDDLQPGEGPLFTRMRLAVLTASGMSVQDEIDCTVADPQIVEPPYGAREVAALLRARFETASPPAQMAFVRTLEAGPGEVELRDIAEWRGRDPEDESALREALEDWQRKRLRWFHDRIPRALAPLAERLHLVPEKPSLETQDLDELGWHSGGVYSRGDISPKTSVELRDDG